MLPLLSLISSAPAAELPWITEVQTPPAVIPEDAPQLAPLLVDAAGQPITTPEAWAARRAELRAWWLSFLGVDLAAQCELDPQVLHEDRVGDVVRQLVSLQVEPGVRMDAYLLHPAEPHGRLPGVVVFHSTSVHTIHQPAGLEDGESHHLGLHLAQQGFVAVCPRNFIWNYPTPQPTYLDAVAELGRRHPGWRGMGKMVFDGLRAVDYLETLPFVDRERLGCIGHSLGAKETLYAMAFDERLKAGVSSEGGIGLRFTNWEDAWYLGPAIQAPDFAHEHHEVLSLVAPRAFLLIGGESADGSRSWPFIAATKPIYDLLGAPDRVGLLTHSSGHALPPLALQCAYGWLVHFLGEGS
jgi:dienelactone hydrolase